MIRSTLSDPNNFTNAPKSAGLTGLPTSALAKTKTKTTNRNQTNMASVNVRPLADRVIVKPLEAQETKKGGIIIPDAHKEKPQEGEVVALGTGKRDDEGKLIAFTVKKGDKVLISKYGGTEIKIGDEAYLIMREDDILGIIG
jgi:chaperonin GroES